MNRFFVKTQPLMTTSTEPIKMVSVTAGESVPVKSQSGEKDTKKRHRHHHHHHHHEKSGKSHTKHHKHAKKDEREKKKKNDGDSSEEEMDTDEELRLTGDHKCSGRGLISDSDDVEDDGDDSSGSLDDFIVDDVEDEMRSGSEDEEGESVVVGNDGSDDEEVVLKPCIPIAHTMTPLVAIALRDDLRSRDITGHNADVVIEYLTNQQLVKKIALLASTMVKKSPEVVLQPQPLPPPPPPQTAKPVAINPVSVTSSFARGFGVTTSPTPAILLPGDERLPLTYAGYVLLLQTTGVSEFFRKTGNPSDYDTYIDKTPAYNKIVAAMSHARNEFTSSFDQIRSLIVDTCYRRRINGAATPTPHTPQSGSASTGNNMMCFSECSHDGSQHQQSTPALCSTTPSISPTSGDSPKFTSTNNMNNGFLAQLFDDACQCYSISINTEATLTNNYPIEYGTPPTSSISGITISSSIPNTDMPNTHVESLTNMCFVGMRFYLNQVSTWKTYIVPRGVALFAVLVNNSKRIDRRVNAKKIFAKLPATATKETILTDINNHIKVHSGMITTLWNAWKTDHAALRSLLTTILEAPIN